MSEESKLAETSNEDQANSAVEPNSAEVSDGKRNGDEDNIKSMKLTMPTPEQLEKMGITELQALCFKIDRGRKYITANYNAVLSVLDQKEQALNGNTII